MSGKNKSSITWCSDNLHGLLGYSDTALASYLSSIASSSSSHKPILKILHDGNVKPIGATSTSDVENILDKFAKQLHQRCWKGISSSPRGGVTSSNKSKPSRVTKRKAETNGDLIRKASKYKLVDLDEEDPIVESITKTKTEKSKTKFKKKKSSKTNETTDNNKKERKGLSSRDDKKQRRRRYNRSSSGNDSDSSNNSNNSSSRKENNIDIVSTQRELEKRRMERRQKREEPQKHEQEETTTTATAVNNNDNKEEQPQKKKESKLTKEERENVEREKDIEERDAFVKRINERDSNHTKQKTQTSNAATTTAAADLVEKEERLARGEVLIDETTGKSLSLDNLRQESRRAYLKKREERELTILEKTIRDEEELFASSNLTTAEKRRMELQKNILKMARDRSGEKMEEDAGEFYRLPDEYEERTGGTKAEKDEALLVSRYKESKQELTEQELWEVEQANRASNTVPIASYKIKKDKQYDFVFDDKIDFGLESTKEGYDHRKGNTTTTGRRSVSPPLPALTEHDKLLAVRRKLPVYPYRTQFLSAVKQNQVLILVGETGSGKTTQIPQYLHEVGYTSLGKIGCTQPRRVAAMSVATRVASEMDVRLGQEVGYSIRFENCTSPKTAIQYMTDGMLLREFLTEPDLKSYSVLVIDEAHERTLHTDILFGLVKDIVRFRTDLRLVISSATLDAEKFSKYFDDASIFMIPGRMFPVDIYYTKAPESDYVEAAVVTVLQIHLSQPLNGDILVFLTGQEEIETAAEALIQKSRSLGSKMKELLICPVYSNLPSEQQVKIFEKTPKGARKVVLATNIAETSLTIDGVCYVIDTGFNKQKSFNARNGMESLVVTPVSQASANQRSGRAGRTQKGKCFRLYTSHSFQKELEPNTVPEILRTNMGNVVLMLKSLGIDDLLHFDFMDPPPPETLIRALEQLYALGALNDRGQLTKLGRRMAEFPVDPTLSKCIIASEKHACVSEVLSTVTMLSLGTSTIFYRPKEKAIHADTARLNFARGGGGDPIALLRCYTEWADVAQYNTQWCFENYVQVRSMKKARDIREQLEGLCDRVEIDATLSSSLDNYQVILQSILSGFFYNTAKLTKSGDYQTIKQHRTVYLHPSSVLSKEESPPHFVMFYELSYTTKEFMREVAPIQASWLVEIAPHFYKKEDIVDGVGKKMPKKYNKNL